MIRQLSDEREPKQMISAILLCKAPGFHWTLQHKQDWIIFQWFIFKEFYSNIWKILKQKYIIWKRSLFLNLDLFRGLSWKTGVNLTKIEHEWKSRGPMRIWNKVRRKKTQEECTTKEFSKQLLKEREKVYISRKQKRNIFA